MVNSKYSYSYSYSHTLGIENLFNSGIGSATLAHADIFIINGYYRVNLWKNSIFWDLGIGAGGINISSDSYKKNNFRLLANFNFMINMKLSDNILLQMLSL